MCYIHKMSTNEFFERISSYKRNFLPCHVYGVASPDEKANEVQGFGEARGSLLQEAHTRAN